MESWVEADRKQVFGVAALDDSYLRKIQALLDERIRALTAAAQEHSA